MKLGQIVLDAVQAQITLEELSSRVYIDMANWCGFAGYSGAQAFFNKRASEELTHRDKIIAFLLDCNYMPKLTPVPAPGYAINSLEDCVKNGLAHEQKVSAAILEIMRKADMEPEDHNAEAFFQWFVNEQREEESIYIDLMGWCTKVGLFSDAPDWAKGMMRAQLDEKLGDAVEGD